ncbi:MAG TPA: hypothetical protein DHW71_13975 [Gammaproteobacteria bacterium]|nr:hypothetical protein [Gammaproteobacteria bacterium]HBF08152.1 hypothetical protein [Gammaproteobacteria bacterium]HCK94099.1 hypothetical protein [Gammaproteobacteria bacterium]|tara:strand:+ start:238 stop:639 length:402 start_codon:yes stop_codon:yes gene_type:complete
MSESTQKWSTKFNDQYQQFNKSLDKVAKAGRGLFALIKDSGTKQFNELVEAGEKSDENLFEQVKTTVSQPFADVRGSVNKAKFASVGLFARVKESSNKYFDELVTEGEKIEKPKAQKTEKSASKAKSSNSKAA